MDARDIKKGLERVLDDYETDRDYLGMSKISRCPRHWYQVLRKGYRPPSMQTSRYAHEGYLHERDILERLARAGLSVVNHNREIVASFDDRFRGHIDGELINSTDGPDLLEVKSANDELYCAIVEAGQPASAHLDQVQCYMRWGGYARTFFIYKARQTGEVWVLQVARDDTRGEALERRARMILAAVDNQTPPACECGHCR